MQWPGKGVCQCLDTSSFCKLVLQKFRLRRFSIGHRLTNTRNGIVQELALFSILGRP